MPYVSLAFFEHCKWCASIVYNSKPNTFTRFVSQVVLLLKYMHQALVHIAMQETHIHSLLKQISSSTFVFKECSPRILSHT